MNYLQACSNADGLGEKGDLGKEDGAGARGNVDVRRADTRDDRGPSLQVDPQAIVFACVIGCLTRTVLLDNSGTDPLTIESIQFAVPSSEFELVNPPPLPADILGADRVGHESLSLEVGYCPGDQFYEDSNTLVIQTNDLSLASGTFEVPVAVKPGAATIEFAHDGNQWHLDFKKETTHWVSMHSVQADEDFDLCAGAEACVCPVSVYDVVVDPPDAGDWYTITPTDPLTEESMFLPYALKTGETIRFDVSYKVPVGQEEDRNATMCIQYVAPFVGPQDYCVPLRALDACEFSIAPVSQSLHFNNPTMVEVVEKPVSLISNGALPCSVSKVSVTNKWGSASEDFALKEVFSGDTTLPPSGLLPVWVQFSPHSSDYSGRLNIEYVDDHVGTVEIAVNLYGDKEDPCALPVADPGDGYDNAVAGKLLTLNGCGSSAGACGSPIYENGYIWFLLSKPEGSTSQLNTEGGCTTSFFPDVAGQYEVALMVYDGTKFLQSELATTVVIVAPAE